MSRGERNEDVKRGSNGDQKVYWSQADVDRMGGGGVGEVI